MALLEMRDLFVMATGRADLDNSTATGANWFINAGQRMLDRMGDFHKAVARHFINLESGQFVVFVPRCRAILQMYMVDSTARTWLTKKTFEWILENHPDLLEGITAIAPGQRAIAANNLGSSLYYAIVPSGVSPVQNDLSLQKNLDHKYGTEGVFMGDHYVYKTLVIVPPTETAKTLDLHGYFDSPLLSNDWDKSWWTERHPEVLLHASCYQLETFYRNTEGAKDWMVAIREGIRGIQIDYALEEVADMTELEAN